MWLLLLLSKPLYWWLSGGNVVGHTSEVTLHRAGLVLRWATSNGYGYQWGRKWKVLRNSRPCDQDCWLTDLVGWRRWLLTSGQIVTYASLIGQPLPSQRSAGNELPCSGPRSRSSSGTLMFGQWEGCPVCKSADQSVARVPQYHRIFASAFPLSLNKLIGCNTLNYLKFIKRQPFSLYLFPLSIVWPSQHCRHSSID